MNIKPCHSRVLIRITQNSNSDLILPGAGASAPSSTDDIEVLAVSPHYANGVLCNCCAVGDKVILIGDPRGGIGVDKEPGPNPKWATILLDHSAIVGVIIPDEPKANPSN